MFSHLVSFLFFFASVASFAQAELEFVVDDENIEKYFVLEENDSIISEEIIVFGCPEPQFPGGDIALIEFINNNVIYPDSAMAQGIEGTVYVGFVIESDGSISNINIVRGVHPLLDNEVIRLMKVMPNWISNFDLNGKPVKNRYIIPIKFNL